MNGEFGHGYLTRKGKNYLAHRYSWMLARGEIPPGLCVLHHCDNPPCVRPDHLYLGTNKDNTRDMLVRRRQRNRPLRGEQNGVAKLSALQVEEIRDLYRKGGFTQHQLAARYGVSRSLVRNIVGNSAWRHLLPAQEGVPPEHTTHI